MVQIDAVTRAVLVNNLQWLTEEMNEYLVRSAFSSNIKVRRDCSCALYDRKGDMLAQGTFIPVHLGIMSQTLKELLKLYPAETLADGDAIIHNDPYMMGSHLYDVMVFKPVFFEGTLFAFTGCLAHQVDMGGSPVGIVNGTIYEEGLRLPGLMLMRGGKVQEDILRLIGANVRTPYEVRGDLMAELAANFRGEMRIRQLAEKYGLEKLTAYFDAILDYSEAGMRSAIAALPDGEMEFEDFIESGSRDGRLTKLRVRVSIRGGDVFLDFNGTDGAGSGNLNAPLSLTCSAAYYAVKALVGTEVSTNSGAYRAVHIVPFETATVLNAQPPSAVGGCTTIPPQRVIDAVIGAFARLIPQRVCACDAQWDGAGFGGHDEKTGRYFSYTETYGAGRGAKHDEDGASAHQTHITNTANTPTELIELEYPFIVERYALADDSGGAGEHRGGLGLVRTLRCLADTYVTALTGRNQTSPYGLFGGECGGNDGAFCRFPDGEERPIVSEKVPKGAVVSIRTGGGGGWGDPRRRDPEKVEWDVLNGYVGIEAAKTRYGREIDPVTLKIIG